MQFNPILMEFGKYKKAKYTLTINRYKTYSFVTTTKDEDECISLLLQKIEGIKYANSSRYEIFKKVDGVETVIKQGKVNN